MTIPEEIMIAMIVGLLSLIGTCITAVFSYLASKRSKEASIQVTNGHSTNLRDDITGIRDDVKLFRAELQDERKNARIVHAKHDERIRRVEERCQLCLKTCD
jgi:ABC-type transport system involved in cytochrome bd biosynthesis fused ATPase/permease subunit